MTMFSLVDSASGGGKSLSIFYEDGDTTTVPDSHPQFDRLIELLVSGKSNDESVRNLVNTLYSIGQSLSRLSERVTTSETNVFFDGDPLRGELADVILDIVRQKGTDNDSLKPLVNFLEKAKTNPSVKSIDDLYRWIVNGELTITPNGDFIGYKGVSVDSDGTSRSINSGKATVNGVAHNGTIPNPDGALVEMPRSEVDPNSKSYCSVGLHVGTSGYAFGFARGRTLLCQVNPRDVVSVPEDCNGEKIRVSRYVVLTHTDQALAERIYSGAYSQDEYDDDDDDEDENVEVCEYCYEPDCYNECEDDYDDEDEDLDLDEDDEEEEEAPHTSYAGEWLRQHGFIPTRKLGDNL